MLDEKCHGKHFATTQRDCYFRFADQGQDAEDLSDDQQLLEGDLEIDSIDILQLILEIERRFGIKLVEGEFDENAWQPWRSPKAATYDQFKTGHSEG